MGLIPPDQIGKPFGLSLPGTLPEFDLWLRMFCHG